jgi:transcriptional regulator with XRE-family HTH domain
MKKTNAIRSLLGITQHDMAMLLHVSRSQWSMYELGKRDLPLAATQLLAELLQHVKTPEKIAKNLPHVAQQQDKKLLQLQRLQKENEYQLLRIARKINTLEKKCTTKVKALQLVAYLTVQSTQKENANTGLLKGIANKASNALESEGLAVLAKYQIKQEVLAFEKQLLESQLQKVTAIPEIKKGKD